jgi:hypothetical protein
MDSTLKIIILLMLGLIVVVLVFLAFLTYILIRDRRTYSTDKPAEKADPLKATPPKKVEPLYGVCANHPDRDGEGICGICELTFCPKCLKEYEKLHFCPEHYKLFRENIWVSIANVKTTPQEAEKGIFLHDFKRDIWKEGTPSYVVTHYKIDVDNDFIESHVELHVREQDSAELSKKISKPLD